MKKQYEFSILPANRGHMRARFVLNGPEAEAFFRSIAKELLPRDPFRNEGGTTIDPLIIRYRRIR